MNKAYKFRIYPNHQQKVLLTKTFGCVRFIYNRMLADKIEHYKRTREQLKNTPAQYKKEFEWLKEVDSLALANAQLNLQAAYTNFFRDKKCGFPKFKSRKNYRQSYTTNYTNGNMGLTNSYLKLPKVGLIKVKQHREIPEGYKLKSVTVSKTSADKYYVSILYDYEKEVEVVKIKKVVGLDFSMKELLVSSDGHNAMYPRFYRQSLEKLAKEQRKLSLSQKGSSNRNKQRIKVAKLYEKTANQRADFLHKLSRQITNAYDAVCIETLNMKGMAQALSFGKSVHDNGWGMFTSFLSYKLREQGKHLVKVDKWFASSKTCSQCQRIKEKLMLSERIYSCLCGNAVNRDINAAINIRNEGMRLVAA